MQTNAPEGIIFRPKQYQSIQYANDSKHGRNHRQKMSCIKNISNQ